MCFSSREREREREINGKRYILHDIVHWKLYFCQNLYNVSFCPICMYFSWCPFMLSENHFYCFWRNVKSNPTTMRSNSQIIYCTEYNKTTTRTVIQMIILCYFSWYVYSSMMRGLRETKEIYIIQYIVKHILF